MAAGASPTQGDQVLIVIDNEFERRYFYSAATAARGLGWFKWPTRRDPGGEVKVYRLDPEASSALTGELKRAPRRHDPNTGKWVKETLERFQTIIQSYTGIRRS